MDKELDEVWNSVGSKISQLVDENQDKLGELKIEAVVQPAMCAEGGFMVGYYPEKGFDIRAYGWSPYSVSKNPMWYKNIHWGTAMGSCNVGVYKFAGELAKEAQAVWDEGIKKMEAVKNG